MDGQRFDSVARSLARRSSRRSLLKALIAIGGGVAVANRMREDDAESMHSWSTLMCLPNNNGAYSTRLVPTAAVPYYKLQGGVIAGQGGTCPVCQPNLLSCDGGCYQCCAQTDCPSGQTCSANLCLAPTPTNTPTPSPVIPTDTPTVTPTSPPVLPSNTPSNTPTLSPVVPSNTPTVTPTSPPVIPSNTPSNTPTPGPV